MELFQDKPPNNAGPPPGGFNWGAFFLTWIWALGNRCFNLVTLVLLLAYFLPYYLGLLSALTLAVYCGVTGNRRAWNHKQWRDHKHFLKSSIGGQWLGQFSFL